MELDDTIITKVLKLLQKKELLSSTRKGHGLTEKGKNIFEILNEYISIPKQVNTPFYPGKKQVLIRIKTNKDIALTADHRNVALKAGADAAFILKFRNRFSAEAIGLEDFETLETMFDFKINNVLVVAFAETLKDATNGALAVALTLDQRLSQELVELELAQ